METTWATGDVLAEKYRLIERLGAGGMGEVWSAEHLGIGSTVAVKLLHPDVAKRPEVAKRFAREARAAAALTSPHVVRVFDHGFERGLPFIVMERLEGETLAARLRAAGPLSPRDALRVVSHVGRALTCAQEAGIVHRDLKPENVFLVPGEDGETAKLLDFGIAKVSPEMAAQAGTAHTQTGAIMGTPRYMSPEQLRERPLDHRSDLWSLALVAFECMTGVGAFSGGVLAEVISDILSGPLPVPSRVAQVPAGFDRWFKRAASRDPAVRFASAREMTDALAAVVENDTTVRGEPAPVREAPPEAPTLGGTQSGPYQHDHRRRGARVWTAVTALAAIALVAVGVVASGSDETPDAPARSSTPAAPPPPPAPATSSPGPVVEPVVQPESTAPPSRSAAPVATPSPKTSTAPRGRATVAPRPSAAASATTKPSAAPAPSPTNELAF